MVIVVAVRAAGVEREHHVQLQLESLQHICKRNVRGPVVHPGRAPLDDAPPHVDHHALNAHVAQSLQTQRELLHRAQLALAGHRVQREHHVHRHSPGAAALRPHPARVRVIKRARLHLHARVENVGNALALVESRTWLGVIGHDATAPPQLEALSLRASQVPPTRGDG